MAENETAIPDCSSVSQLQRVDENDALDLLSAPDALLLLVSEKHDGMQTGYISKCMRYTELSTLVKSSLDIAGMNNQISGHQDIIDDLVKFKNTRLSVHGQIRCNDIEEPYIISAIGLSNTLINGLSGYELSTGMGKVFSRHKVAAISAETLRADDIWLGENRLNYEDLVKDVFLSSVAVSGDQLVFNFITWEGEPQPISVALTSIAPPEVKMRDWTV